mmetsp:Transcript_19462/g.42557  ORF Transcript_19462/g.42557 Transcript_19462/m.42557 type:complete len:245 (-) Transcript_19462:60-794(-)
MNYSFDTEMELDWAADQLRRAKNRDLGLPDTPIRRVTAALHQSLAPPVDPSVSADTTLGSAVSALAIHAHNPEHCLRIGESLLALLADRDRVALHHEFVRLKGLDLVIDVVKQHNGDSVLVALRILDKLSRTSPRALCTTGGLESVIERCEQDRYFPRILEASLRVLHGLSFDLEAKELLLRRGVRGFVESVLETGQPEIDEGAPRNRDWDDALSMGLRVLQRLQDGQKGYSRRGEMGRAKPLM